MASPRLERKLRETGQVLNQLLGLQRENNEYEMNVLLNKPRDVPATRTEGFRKDRE